LFLLSYFPDRHLSAAMLDIILLVLFFKKEHSTSPTHSRARSVQVESDLRSDRALALCFDEQIHRTRDAVWSGSALMEHAE
jgi:hypothetical protein